jgi:hypothetical protein
MCPRDAQRDDRLLTIVEKKFKSKKRIAFLCARSYHEVDKQTKKKNTMRKIIVTKELRKFHEFREEVSPLEGMVRKVIAAPFLSLDRGHTAAGCMIAVV